MDLTKIISISGKPGLYSLVKQSRNGFIVELLGTNKKTSVPSSNNVSLLTNVAMYTSEGEVPLGEVFAKIAQKENAGPAISHKVSGAELHAYFEGILPTYDKSRVYDSDLKKLFQWYNTLQSSGMINLEELQDDEQKEVELEQKPKAETKEKKAPAKTVEKKTTKTTAKAKPKEEAEEKPKAKKTTAKAKKED